MQIRQILGMLVQMVCERMQAFVVCRSYVKYEYIFRFKVPRFLCVCEWVKRYFRKFYLFIIACIIFSSSDSIYSYSELEKENRFYTPCIDITFVYT